MPGLKYFLSPSTYGYPSVNNLFPSITLRRRRIFLCRLHSTQIFSTSWPCIDFQHLNNIILQQITSELPKVEDVECSWEKWKGLYAVSYQWEISWPFTDSLRVSSRKVTRIGSYCWLEMFALRIIMFLPGFDSRCTHEWRKRRRGRWEKRGWWRWYIHLRMNP